MKNVLFIILSLLVIMSCNKDDDNQEEQSCPCETVEVYDPDGATLYDRLVPIKLRICEAYPGLTREQAIEEFKDYPLYLAVQLAEYQGCD